MSEEQRRGSEPQREDKSGKLPELAPHARLKFRAHLLEFRVDLVTQLLNISVDIVE